MREPALRGLLLDDRGHLRAAADPVVVVPAQPQQRAVVQRPHAGVARLAGAQRHLADQRAGGELGKRGVVGALLDHLEATGADDVGRVARVALVKQELSRRQSRAADALHETLDLAPLEPGQQVECAQEVELLVALEPLPQRVPHRARAREQLLGVGPLQHQQLEVLGRLHDGPARLAARHRALAETVPRAEDGQHRRLRTVVDHLRPTLDDQADAAVDGAVFDDGVAGLATAWRQALAQPVAFGLRGRSEQTAVAQQSVDLVAHCRVHHPFLLFRSVVRCRCIPGRRFDDTRGADPVALRPKAEVPRIDREMPNTRSRLAGRDRVLASSVARRVASHRRRREQPDRRMSPEDGETAADCVNRDNPAIGRPARDPRVGLDACGPDRARRRRLEARSYPCRAMCSCSASASGCGRVTRRCRSGACCGSTGATVRPNRRSDRRT